MQYKAITYINHNGAVHAPGDVFDAHPSEMKQALEVGAVAPERSPYSVCDSEGGEHD